MFKYLTQTNQYMLNSSSERTSHSRQSVKRPASSSYFVMQPLAKMTTRTAPADHREPLYRIVIISDGHYEYRLGRRILTLNSGTIGLIKPRDNYELDAPFHVSGWVISFTQDFLQSALSPAAQTEALHLGLSSDLDHVSIAGSDSQFLLDISRRLFEEYSEKGMNDEMMTRLFGLLMLYINRSLTTGSSITGSKSHHHTRRFIGLLEKYFITHKMAGDYADLMAVTPAYLNNVIKETLGNTTRHFINQRIFTEAKRLIIYDELTMKEVADRLGFMDPSHFSKFFKRIAGKKFTEFKRTYTN